MLLISADATDALGVRLAHRLRIGDVITLSGSLGAGKTALARGVIAGLGFDGDVPSPSFPLVVAYSPPELRLPLWHVDLYRIDDPRDIDELGLDEAQREAALIIEWPERLPRGGWAGALDLALEIMPNNARRLTAQVPPSWKDRWPAR